MRGKAFSSYAFGDGFFNRSNLCGIRVWTRVRPAANELLRAKEECC
jgi:hypothetical protein